MSLTVGPGCEMNPDEKLPKYQMLKREIEQWLEEGKFQPEDMMPTEHEIAARYGMSRQTVRQAIGDLVNDGLLYRVQGKGTFVAKGGRDRAAFGGVQTIGMVATYISDYIFPHIVRGAEAELRSRGCRLLLSSTDNDKAKERDSLSAFLEQPASGLIIEPTKSAQGNPNLDLYLELQRRGTPIVMINERYPELSFPCLRVDDEAGGYRAAEHLIGLNHRVIAGFFKTDDLQGVHRLKGFMRACSAHRLPLRPDLVTTYTTEERHEKPVNAARRLLSQDQPPTAFVCYNDELAVALLDAAKSLGIPVPERLSIVGFDDSSLAAASSVKLTTLTHPKAEMGARAAELIMGMLGETPREPGAGAETGADAGAGAGAEAVAGAEAKASEDVVYQPELIVRESTAPAAR